MVQAWIWLAGAWWIAALGTYLVTTLLALWYFRRQPAVPAHALPPVSILVPMRGLDPELEVNLDALFGQVYGDFEVLASVADAADPAISLVRRIMADHPLRAPRLLVGDVAIGRNPKVQNLMRIYDLARHDLVLMCDSNVQLRPTALAEMAAQFAPDVGMVSAVAVAVRPGNFVAELECAMLNGYGARWQTAAAALGLGVAVGKILFVRKGDLDRVGGLAMAAPHPCEDRAIDNALRGIPRRVVMAHAPVDNPIGVRRFRDFWSRHQRYMWCRRAFSGFVFYIEPLLGAAIACLAGGLFWGVIGGPAAASGAVLGTLAVWFLVEAAHLRLQGWFLSWLSPAAWLLRECLLPFLWMRAATARTLRWQDAEFEATVA